MLLKNVTETKPDRKTIIAIVFRFKVLYKRQTRMGMIVEVAV